MAAADPGVSNLSVVVNVTSRDLVKEKAEGSCGEVMLKCSLLIRGCLVGGGAFVGDSCRRFGRLASGLPGA